MTNIVQFKPKTVTVAEPVEQAVAPDEWYFVSELDTAIKIAAYVYKDVEAVDMLLAEMRRFLATATSMDYLPEEVRTRCALYLVKNEQHKEDVTKSIEYIYSS
jgi:hypothetical protein